jgi:hypothetical protein
MACALSDLRSIYHVDTAICGFSSTDIALKICLVKAAATYPEYEMLLYIAILHAFKTINKLDSAIAMAADIGRAKPLLIVL